MHIYLHTYKLVQYFKIPFYRLHSNKIRNELKRTLKDSFNDVDCRIVMTIVPFYYWLFFSKLSIPFLITFGGVLSALTNIRVVVRDIWDTLVDLLRHAGLNI